MSVQKFHFYYASIHSFEVEDATAVTGSLNTQLENAM